MPCHNAVCYAVQTDEVLDGLDHLWAIVGRKCSPLLIATYAFVPSASYTPGIGIVGGMQWCAAFPISSGLLGGRLTMMIGHIGMLMIVHFEAKGRYVDV